MVRHNYKCSNCGAFRVWGATEVRTPESTVKAPLLTCANCSQFVHVLHSFQGYQMVNLGDYPSDVN